MRVFFYFDPAVFDYVTSMVTGKDVGVTVHLHIVEVEQFLTDEGRR